MNAHSTSVFPRKPPDFARHDCARSCSGCSVARVKTSIRSTFPLSRIYSTVRNCVLTCFSARGHNMYETFPEDNVERSYGIIPLRISPSGEFELLTIQHLSTGEYGFPKGHPEEADANPLVGVPGAVEWCIQFTSSSSCPRPSRRPPRNVNYWKRPGSRPSASYWTRSARTLSRPTSILVPGSRR